MANFVLVPQTEQQKEEPKKEESKESEVATGMKTDPVDLEGSRMPAP